MTEIGQFYTNLCYYENSPNIVKKNDYLIVYDSPKLKLALIGDKLSLISGHMYASFYHYYNICMFAYMPNVSQKILNLIRAKIYVYRTHLHINNAEYRFRPNYLIRPIIVHFNETNYNCYHFDDYVCVNGFSHRFIKNHYKSHFIVGSINTVFPSDEFYGNLWFIKRHNTIKFNPNNPIDLSHLNLFDIVLAIRQFYLSIRIKSARKIAK